MYGLQIILVFCVVALAYCHHGHAKTTSNEQLIKGLLDKELLPEQVRDLLRNYNQPMAIELAKLNEPEERHCRLVPLNTLKVEISESWDSVERHDSPSLNNYLENCEKIRKEKCGEKAFVDDRNDYTLSYSFSSQLSERTEPTAISSLLEPYALDSNIFPWVEYGKDDDLSKCRYMRDLIYQEVNNKQIPLSIIDLISYRRMKTYWFCFREFGARLDEFRDHLEKLQGENIYRREKLMNLVAAAGEYAPNIEGNELNLQKLKRNEINVIKSNYLSNYFPSKPPNNHRKSNEKFLRHFEHLRPDQISDQISDRLSDRIWKSLLSACESYTSVIGADNVEKFILGIYSSTLEKDELKWFAALTICHDLLNQKNKEEDPYHFHVQTQVHSLAAKYKLDIATKKGYYLNVIYD